MKKKKLTNTLDNIFSEIDFKENTINGTNDVKIYSLDILSDVSDSSENSIQLEDYDLDTESSTDLNIESNNLLSNLNTQQFFNCLLDNDHKKDKSENIYNSNNK